MCAAFTTRVTLYSLHEHLSKKLKKLKQKPMLQVTPCRMPDSSDDEAVQDALNVFRRGAHYIQFFPASTIVAIASKTLQKLKGGGTQLVPIVHIVQLPSTGTATDGSSTTLIIPPRLLMQLSVDHGSNDVTPYDAIAVSPDGTFVAGGTIGGTVRLWSIGNGGEVVCHALARFAENCLEPPERTAGGARAYRNRYHFGRRGGQSLCESHISRIAIRK